jgi:hypothetical protein
MLTANGGSTVRPSPWPQICPAKQATGVVNQKPTALARSLPIVPKPTNLGCGNPTGNLGRTPLRAVFEVSTSVLKLKGQSAN